MEAIGSGASTLAFIGLATQSAKTLYEFFSALQNGPQEVERAANNIQTFLSSLEHLSQTRALSEGTPQFIVETREHIQKCIDEMDAISANLGVLKISDREKRAGILWKKVKFAFKEKSVSQISDIIGHHASQLSLRLHVIHCNIGYGPADRLRFQSIEQKVQQQIEMTIGQTQLEEEQRNILLGLRDEMVHARNDCDTIYQAIGGMSSISSSNATQIMDVLQQLKVKVERVAASQEQSVTKDKGREVDTDDLLAVIQRLCNLVNKKERILNETDAEDLTDDIQKLLKHLRLLIQVDQTDAEDEEMLSREYWSGQELKTDLRTMEGLTLGSPGIALNKPSPLLSYQGCVIVQNTRNRKVFNEAGGTLTITTTKRRLIGCSDDSTSFDKSQDDLIATLTFVPKHPANNKMFELSVQRRTHDSGVVSSIPHFSVNLTLPAGSRVFRLVAEGRMKDFTRMLRDGTASVRDHDEYGASLLHYAMSGERPEMLKFLTSHGLDVNHVAENRGVNILVSRHFNLKSTPIALPIVANLDLIKGRMEIHKSQVKECRRILLDAGCDPTIQGFLSDNSYGGQGSQRGSDLVSDILDTGDIESIQLLIDSGTPFFAVNAHIDTEFRTPLLSLCESGRATPLSIQILLNRGADVNARNVYGETCLHVFSKIRDHNKGMNDMALCYQKVMLLLIEHGADIFAQDYKGVSVSEAMYPPDSYLISGYLYLYRTDDTKWRKSYLGDIWDSIVAHRGYDIARFRQGRSRVAMYSRDYTYSDRYTRMDFERLWKGIEHLCPYYDVPEGVAYDFSKPEARVVGEAGEVPRERNEDHHSGGYDRQDLAECLYEGIFAQSGENPGSIT